MALITKYNDPFKLVDRTDELLIIPNQWGLVNDIGLFKTKYVTGTTFYVDEHEQFSGLPVDLPRGTKPSAGKEDKRRRRYFETPHFPLRQSIKPSDISQSSRNGDGIIDSLDLARMEKMEYVRRSFAILNEVAKCQMLSTGDVYSPNGNVVLNVYTDFGVTRKDIDFTLGTGTTEILMKGEEAIAHTQDNIGNGGIMNGVIALCHPTFFNRLTTHQSVKAAYQFFNSSQEPLRQRLGGSNSMYRSFEHGGITYMEYRGATNAGVPFIPAGECRFVPTGTDFFKTYYTSADKFSYVNAPGLEAYYFERLDEDDDEWSIDAETNFANLCLNPKIMIRGFSSN